MVVTAAQGQTNALRKGKTSLVHPGLSWILQEKKFLKTLKFQMSAPLLTLDEALSCQTNGF